MEPGIPARRSRVTLSFRRRTGRKPSTPLTPPRWVDVNANRRLDKRSTRGSLRRVPRRSANILVCGFTELSSSVFPKRVIFGGAVEKRNPWRLISHTVLPAGGTGNWKVAVTRRQECRRYGRGVAQTFLFAGSRNFPVPCSRAARVFIPSLRAAWPIRPHPLCPQYNAPPRSATCAPAPAAMGAK